MKHPQDLLKLTTKERLEICLRRFFACISLSRVLMRVKPKRRRGYGGASMVKIPRRVENRIFAKIIKKYPLECLEKTPFDQFPVRKQFRIGDLQFEFYDHSVRTLPYIRDIRMVDETGGQSKIVEKGEEGGEVDTLLRWWIEGYLLIRVDRIKQKQYDVHVKEDQINDLIFRNHTKDL